MGWKSRNFAANFLPEGYEQVEREGRIFTFTDEGRPICGALRSDNSGKICHSPPGANSNRCRLHGGKTPRGIESANYKHGRYSNALFAKSIAEAYQQALDDPDYMAMRTDMALTTARINQLLERIDTGESMQAWKAAQKATTNLRDCLADDDAVGANEALTVLEEVILQGISDYYTWEEIRQSQEHKRKMAGSELKLLQAKEQFITAEQAMVLISQIIKIIRDNITDKELLDTISAKIRDVAVEMRHVMSHEI